MSSALLRIAEEHVARAVAAGDFDRLPGAGRPLDLGDELLVPPEVRMANRILKNAGRLPPELEFSRETRDAAAETAAREGTAVRDAPGRLAALRNALESAGSLNRPAWARYAPQLLRCFTRQR